MGILADAVRWRGGVGYDLSEREQVSTVTIL